MPPKKKCCPLVKSHVEILTLSLVFVFPIQRGLSRLWFSAYEDEAAPFGYCLCYWWCHDTRQILSEGRKIKALEWQPPSQASIPIGLVGFVYFRQRYISESTNKYRITRSRLDLLSSQLHSIWILLIWCGPLCVLAQCATFHVGGGIAMGAHLNTGNPPRDRDWQD